METKVKTTVTISAKVLEKADVFAKKYKNRSEFVETALRELIAKLERKQREARDIEIINRNADELNKEAMDVLDFQFDW
jgi:metal-responsive CopG/Arc/MetJ family transcriptional regulator